MTEQDDRLLNDEEIYQVTGSINPGFQKVAKAQLEKGDRWDREKIAIQTCDEFGSDNWTDLLEGERQDYYDFADQIIATCKGE